MVVAGGLIGVAREAIAAGELGAITVEGLFAPVKVNGAISAGDLVYWDATGDPQGGTAGTGAATTTSAGNTLIGVAIADAAITDETVDVRINNPVNVSASPALPEIADPGDAGAIPVTTGGTVKLVSATSETRTIADPTFLGQTITLTALTLGGGIIVTAASPVNQAGNTAMTFGLAGDTIMLVCIARTAGLEWHAASNDGVTLS